MRCEYPEALLQTRVTPRARERDVMSAALSTREQQQLLHLVAKVQQAALTARPDTPSAPARKKRS